MLNLLIFCKFDEEEQNKPGDREKWCNHEIVSVTEKCEFPWLLVKEKQREEEKMWRDCKFTDF